MAKNDKIADEIESNRAGRASRDSYGKSSAGCRYGGSRRVVQIPEHAGNTDQAAICRPTPDLLRMKIGSAQFVVSLWFRRIEILLQPRRDTTREMRCS
jgi:hypothetical protein